MINREFAGFKEPETADEWAVEILACVSGLVTAAPDAVYRPIHKRLIGTIAAIEEKADPLRARPKRSGVML
jgi:hypothetical protein